MPDPLSLDETLAKAREKAEAYNWLDASTIYKGALAQTDPERDPAKAARVTTLLAKSLHRRAFQAETRAIFKERMKQSQDAYSDAAVLYEKAGAKSQTSLSRSDEVVAQYWIADTKPERIAHITRAITAVREAARLAEEAHDPEAVARAYENLARFYLRSFELSRDFKSFKQLAEDAIHAAEKAVESQKRLDNPTVLLECMEHLADALIILQTLTRPGTPEYERKLETLVKEMKELSVKIGTPYARLIQLAVEGAIALELKGEFKSSLSIAEEAVRLARLLGDRAMMGGAGSGTLSAMFWTGVGEEDPEEKRALLEGVAQEASLIISYLEVPLLVFPIENAREGWAESQTLLAVHVETHVERKKELLRRAIQISRESIEWGAAVGSPGLKHSLAKALLFLSQLETDETEKVRLLQESLKTREENLELAKVLLGADNWDVGVQRNYLALAKSELSRLEKIPEKKLELLESAAVDMEDCLRICSAAASPGQIPALAQYEEWSGDMHAQTFELKRDPSFLEKAISSYSKAAEHQDKLGHPSATARLEWKIARAEDAAGNFSNAAREFREAAKAFTSASKKIPASTSTFNETSAYMSAWACIEDARAHHTEGDYLLSAENYQKAADLLGQTRHWSFLTKHYMGCSFLEGGEALSRQERPDSSKESFLAAASAFREAMEAIENASKHHEDSTHHSEMKNWVDVNAGRARYCDARIDLEEARILDKKGEKAPSSSKYQSASRAFKTMSATAQNLQTREELETLHMLCEAWSRMKDAESKASPELYAEASEIFLATEKIASKEKIRILAMANASICKALESGTKFRRTRDTGLYAEIKKRLEAAADFYQEAGFKNAADWTRATQRMFDALAYLTDAEVERDPKKKADLYHLAQRHLQLAARLYGDAGFQAKKEEALGHLERIREEKELALTPLDALAGNPVASSASVAPVTLVRDQAVGLDRFEEANIAGNLKVSQTQLPVGSTFDIRLDMVNVGKTSATLMKAEGLGPEGLELNLRDTRLEKNGQLVDLKGKRLDSLKTHELTFSLKASRKGSFQLKPRVLFLDEKGTYKSYEFEPVTLTVIELGISGWLKGPK